MAENGGRRRSPYYSHFQIADTPDLNRKKASCNYCPQVLSCTIMGCTGNLARHIRWKHPEVMTAIEEEQAKQVTTTEYEYAEDRTGNGSPSSSVFLLNVSDEDCHSQDERELKLNLEREQEFETSQVDAKVKKAKKSKKDGQYESYPDVEAKKSKMAAVNRETSQEGTMADRFDIFGSLVAVKMRGLDRDQMILAEKLINDTLHEAEMSNLTRFCSLKLVHVDMVDEGKPDVLS